MGKLKGTLRLLHDKIMVSDMNFGEEVTASGLIIQSDNAKREGVHPRWAKVWAIGPEQEDVKVGEWILIEHGRWTRTIEYEQEDGTILELRMVEPKAVICSADEKPSDIMRAEVSSNTNFNIPGA